MKDIGLTIDEFNEVIGYIRNNPKIKKVIVYGSRAKGNYRQFSDVDMTLIGDNLVVSDLASLEDSLYFSFLPYKFDLSIFENLKNFNLIDHINRVGVVIYDKVQQG
ncbi:MAG: nucleotidyltransferase domain-containing protein [Muribaculaceae bacterium]|nr:nucleotidyltransferase domain-containing protein [Muribaculaceae bacterium]